MTVAPSLNPSTPSTCSPAQRSPRILLAGSHQPTLLRYLDGWPNPSRRPRTFLIQFVREDESLAQFPSNGFDLAVVQAPTAERVQELVRELTRVARQGLIVRPRD
ncbi:MAG: class I SAM-dependent methyltransferase [Pseudomonas sp.]|uniref:class I SAM-dependent methyltransferase n=1 Tax=Pseudomonas sp. TaxID=306 RepID=UPI003392AD66